MAIRRVIIFIALLLLSGVTAYAQFDPLTQARTLVAEKKYDEAISLYGKLYDQNPTDADVYGEYLNLLLQAKDYKKAEAVVNDQLEVRRHHPLVVIDLGRVYKESGKGKKANEKFEEAIIYINGEDLLTQQVANAFSRMGEDAYAIKAYERARELTRNPYTYASALTRLYGKTGEVDKAVATMLDAAAMQYAGNADDAKATLLEILGNDPKKLQQAQKALVKKINEQPENPFFAELLTWLYTQKDDWEGALIQVQALDTRNREDGRRLLDFARYAAKAKQYAYAQQAFDAIIEKGTSGPLYSMARAEKLNMALLQLQNDPAFTQAQAKALAQEYEAFLTEFPSYYPTKTLTDYALLEARYAGNPQHAVTLLQKAIDVPSTPRNFKAAAKLQMGDYHILLNQVWEATLLYSQVDKDFKEDALGEDARFRNAKLAYYRGDFAWAQEQLSVLKASTSELIANDALYLSVLITENITPDSNYVPIRRFAYADLLLFQNKDKEAEALLDSIATAFPQHPLNDDILLLKATLAQKHRDYAAALGYLQRIFEQYGKDVLGDDAVFRTAELYEQYLNKPQDAKKYYEQLIIDYPGSTYVQTARTRLNIIQTGGAPVVP